MLGHLTTGNCTPSNRLHPTLDQLLAVTTQQNDPYLFYEEEEDKLAFIWPNSGKRLQERKHFREQFLNANALVIA